MGILDKILGVLLALAIVCGGASLWYADHEHSRIKPLQDQISAARLQAQQAAAARQAALDSAAAAQRQLMAAEAATSAAQAAAAEAASTAAAAHARVRSATKTPSTARVLNTAVPGAVWQAIYGTEK